MASKNLLKSFSTLEKGRDEEKKSDF